MTTVIWRPQARRDLFTLLVDLELRSPAAASRLCNKIEANVQLLLAHPKLGMLRPDLGASVRVLVAGKLLVLYRLLPEDTAEPTYQIRIVRVLHGSRDLAGIL